MEWTKEKPTKPGRYWRIAEGDTHPFVAGLDGSNLADPSLFPGGLWWPEPIAQPPLPPAPKKIMFFTKPREVHGQWWFQRFEERDPKTERIYGPYSTEARANDTLLIAANAFAATHVCVRSSRTLAPDPNLL